jgi:hypothetical protein
MTQVSRAFSVGSHIMMMSVYLKGGKTKKERRRKEVHALFYTRRGSQQNTGFSPEFRRICLASHSDQGLSSLRTIMELEIHPKSNDIKVMQQGPIVSECG